MLPGRRRALPLVLAILAGAAAAGADAPAPSNPNAGTAEGEPVSCGNTSPLGNQCPLGEVRLGVNPSAQFVVAPFIGRLTLAALQSHPDPPFFGVLRWTCDALGVAATTECAEPVEEGRLIPGRLATVQCIASSYPGASATPPVGVWGCALDPGSAPTAS